MISESGCGLMQRSFKMSERPISLGINISIIVILTIFGVLLSLPLRLLLNTNYSSEEQSTNENETIETLENSTKPQIIIPAPVDYRKLMRCPRFQYEDQVKSVFLCDYDGNCTYTRPVEKIEKKEIVEEEKKIDVTTKAESVEEETKMSKEIVGEDLNENTKGSDDDRRMKSIPVAGHILVTMLVVSAIAALVEVLRIRFAKEKDSSKSGNVSSRKGSTVDLPVQRRFIPRQPMKSQRSFEMQGMHRSALRLLGARPPPLIRRSSFPIQQAKQHGASVTGTPNTRASRRQSAESEEEIGVLITALHHRTRLIRRH